jgi:Tfp pilus assembly protein PilF
MPIAHNRFLVSAALLCVLTACGSGPSSSPDRAVSVLCADSQSQDSGARSGTLNAYSQRALLGIGYEAMQNGNTACAERLLTEAIRLDPKDPWALLNLGVAQHRQGKLDQARISYQSAAAQDPTTSGIALGAQGKSAQEPEVAVAASSSSALKQSPGQIALQNLKLIP